MRTHIECPLVAWNEMVVMRASCKLHAVKLKLNRLYGLYTFFFFPVDTAGSPCLRFFPVPVLSFALFVGVPFSSLFFPALFPGVADDCKRKEVSKGRDL
jgi:hypothetical protein